MKFRYFSFPRSRAYKISSFFTSHLPYYTIIIHRYYQTEQEVKKEHIFIRDSQREADMFFRIRRDVPLQKLILGYCKRLNLRREKRRFIYDGKRIDPTHTADDLEMEDEDYIDVCSEQLGGGGVDHPCMW